MIAMTCSMIAVASGAALEIPAQSVPGQKKHFTPSCDEHVPCRCSELEIQPSLHTALALAETSAGRAHVFDPGGGVGTGVGAGMGVGAGAGVGVGVGAGAGIGAGADSRIVISTVVFSLTVAVTSIASYPDLLVRKIYRPAERPERL
jgi:hypothetical protein